MMVSPRTILKDQLDAVNASLVENPAVIDPRLATQADLQVQIAKADNWLDMDIEAIKAALATDWNAVKEFAAKYL